MFNKPDFTCVDCEERHAGCHAECSKYLDEKEKYNTQSEKIRKHKKSKEDFYAVRTSYLSEKKKKRY